jgi:hypothetical protein
MKAFACSFEIKIGNAKLCKSNEKHEKGCIVQIRSQDLFGALSLQ